MSNPTFSSSESECESAKQAYITMSNVDTVKFKVVGLAMYKPNNGQPFKVREVFATTNDENTNIKSLAIDLEDGSQFSLRGSVHPRCCEKLGYHFGLPTTNRKNWTNVNFATPKLGPGDGATNEATAIYMCEVSHNYNFVDGREIDSEDYNYIEDVNASIIAFTDNPQIPLIGYYNIHNGYYTHGVVWSFTGPDGQKLASGKTVI